MCKFSLKLILNIIVIICIIKLVSNPNHLGLLHQFYILYATFLVNTDFRTEVVQNVYIRMYEVND